jgi:hypothetical protein
MSASQFAKTQEDLAAWTKTNKNPLTFLPHVLQDAKAAAERPVISYVSNFVRGRATPSSGIQPLDKILWSDAIETVPAGEKSVDLILHSPGGSPHGADAIVSLLRGRFTNLRVIVPSQAMSAATMMAMAADEIWMDARSELGPIDPQMLTPSGYRSAQSILDGWAAFRGDEDRKNIAAWLAMSRGWDLAFFEVCKAQMSFSQALVAKWIAEFMLNGQENAESKAKTIAGALGDAKTHHTHGRALHRNDLESLGITVRDLNDWPTMQHASWRLYCAHEHLFNNTFAIPTGGKATIGKILMTSEGYMNVAMDAAA